MGKNKNQIKIHIAGMGALGIMYGDFIKKHGGDVAFVMDKQRFEKYGGKEVFCNDFPQSFQMEESSQASPADLVIVAVKYSGLPSVMETIQNSVGENTVILSVMNGIMSEAILADRYGWNKVIYAIAEGMDAMKFGSRLRYTRMGKIVIGGTRPEQKKQVEKVAGIFRSLELPYEEATDIMHRLWGKFMLNVGVNQVCMAYGTDYEGALGKNREAHEDMLGAMKEVLALGNAEGIPLTEKDIDYYVGLLKQLDPKGMPSMAQDRISRRPSEVEMFAGTVIPLGKKHGISTPVNQKLYNKILEIEKGYQL